jgi:hypothetical protein
VPSLPTAGETVTAAYLRSITDDDAESQLRHPKLWSYIARDPDGVIFSHGRVRTRTACERRAISHAAEHAEELWLISKLNREPWPLDGWRFVTWPPSVPSDHSGRPILGVSRSHRSTF